MVALETKTKKDIAKLKLQLRDELAASKAKAKPKRDPIGGTIASKAKLPNLPFATPRSREEAQEFMLLESN